MKTLLKKSIETIKNKGLSSFFQKTGAYINRKINPFIKRVIVPYVKFRIRRLNPEENEVSVLVGLIFDKFAGLIAPAQVRSEINALAKLVKELKPKTVLEIGTAEGGTLFLFSRLADSHAKVISVDLPGGEFGGGYPEWKIDLYKSFSLPFQELYLLRENSHSNSTREQVKEIIGATPIDFLFIDGDHTYEGAKNDFEMYAPLVKDGGIIAFHDIAQHPPEKNCNVHKFWEEIKGENSQEFIENPNQKWAGIGVYRKIGL